MESFWNGFEKQAKDKKDDASWWEKQKGLARATRKGESGLGLALAHPCQTTNRWCFTYRVSS